MTTFTHYNPFFLFLPNGLFTIRIHNYEGKYDDLDSADVSALLGISAAVHRIGVQFLRVVSWKTASNRANGAAQLG